MTTSSGSTSSSRSSSSSTCSLIVSTTSSRTGGPNRRRASSRSSACSRSSSRSSSTSRSALRVTRKAWHLRHLHAGEQLRQVRGDEVLDRQEGDRSSSGSSVATRHQARHVVGHLHTREPLGAALGVADGDGQVEREAGDVGERVRGVDGQRRQHREDGRGEVGRQPRRAGRRSATTSRLIRMPSLSSSGHTSSRNTCACATARACVRAWRCGPAARAG